MPSTFKRTLPSTPIDRRIARDQQRARVLFQEGYDDFNLFLWQQEAADLAAPYSTAPKAYRAGWYAAQHCARRNGKIRFS